MDAQPSPSAPAMFCLVDLENTQPVDFHRLHGRNAYIKVFVGAKQEKISLQLAEKLQPLGKSVEYIRCASPGPNALDFHLAFYLGALITAYPQAEFYIISKDSGFDPLVKHLRSKRLKCQRIASLAEVDKVPDSTRVAEKAQAFVDSLKNPKATRPRTLKTLESAIRARFKNLVEEGEAEQIVLHLTRRGIVKNKEGKLSYELPAEASA